jgi:tryptophanyl-tRNA synthetase
MSYRILTGIQSTGTPHLGNLFGSILPTIEKVNYSFDYSFIFIADLHSITQIKNSIIIKEYTYQVAATWLACGLNIDRVVFYKQSDVPQVTELAWYLNCFYPYHRLKLSHSFKDKIHNIKNINNGLFTYPILMAADILLYDAKIITVGKDQLQHLEIVRDVASRFNRKIGKKVFIIPIPYINQNNMYIIGTDGKKMSKSRGNIINIFLSNDKLKKQIMCIKTSNLSIESRKNPDKDIIFRFYKLIANKKDTDKMRQNYLTGGYGYKNAKEELYNYIIQRFSKEREKFFYIINNKYLIDKALNEGAKKAIKIADSTLNRVRKYLGFSWRDGRVD